MTNAEGITKSEGWEVPRYLNPVKPIDFVLRASSFFSHSTFGFRNFC